MVIDCGTEFQGLLGILRLDMKFQQNVFGQLLRLQDVWTFLNVVLAQPPATLSCISWESLLHMATHCFLTLFHGTRNTRTRELCSLEVGLGSLRYIVSVLWQEVVLVWLGWPSPGAVWFGSLFFGVICSPMRKNTIGTRASFCFGWFSFELVRYPVNRSLNAVISVLGECKHACRWLSGWLNDTPGHPAFSSLPRWIYWCYYYVQQCCLHGFGN